MPQQAILIERLYQLAGRELRLTEAALLFIPGGTSWLLGIIGMCIRLYRIVASISIHSAICAAPVLRGYLQIHVTT